MFLNTLAITLKKARIVAEKVRVAGISICPRDERGRHNNHPSIAERAKGIVRDHIRKFPAYESHYSRNRTAKKYLRSDLRNIVPRLVSSQ